MDAVSGNGLGQVLAATRDGGQVRVYGALDGFSFQVRGANWVLRQIVLMSKFASCPMPMYLNTLALEGAVLFPPGFEAQGVPVPGLLGPGVPTLLTTT